MTQESRNSCTNYLRIRSPFDIMCSTDNPDQNTEDYLFQYILEKTIRIPRSISVKAQSVLKAFLNKNPADRLGT